MTKDTITFDVFIRNVSPLHTEYVSQTHGFMLDNGCTVKIETAKSGHVLSYVHAQSKRVVANYVFRKAGLIIRIYGDHIADYPEIIPALPAAMVKSVEKAPACRRLLDMTKCNSRCPMGYVFDINGVTHKKCRYGSFMFAVTEENYDAIRDFLARELAARAA